ncbi:MULTISPECIES: hypothetical protein [unclassified Bartonella]|uniref:hypothetical protein n=1 Tax=unclassified Bartonella TaxID=2645622 RepID=UPI0015FBAA60|nr:MULTISPECIES: hypothetical protein [unclassified Bartonella]UXN03685.1 hypothetical protein N6B01_01170 [Bartonella sp. HY406]UXN06657.1 hypothetical protein N6A79_01180 [Bartonella sp. HY761]
MSIFEREQSEVEKLKKHITNLREELNALTQKSKDMHLLDDAHELGERLRQHGRRAAHEVADQAMIVRDKVKENPKTTLAVVAAIGFLAGAFFWTRR